MIVSYGHSKWGGMAYPIIPSASVAYDLPIWGTDMPIFGFGAYHWGNIGAIETGELLVDSEGGKATLQEVWTRTYTDGTTPPAVIVGTRAPGDSDWTYMGSKDGTIELTTGDCYGTGTAFSRSMESGSGTDTVFTTPCQAVDARILVDGVTQVVGVDYTVTGPMQITFTTAPSNGAAIVAYWDNRPFVLMEAGDYLETTYGYHRIVSIARCNELTAEWFPPYSTAAYHRIAHALDVGETETVVGIYRSVTRVQIRILVVPRRVADASSDVKVLGATIVSIPSGVRQLKG